MYTMNAKEYNDKVMNGHFKKIYPVIAGQIIERTGVSEGFCIDLGGGPGMLGISLAKASKLKVTIYDLLKECVDLVAENSDIHGVSDQVSAICGAAEDIRFKDESADLVVSRGSVFFWEDQQKGFSEIYRVLKKGGWAYIGGGFGSAELLKEVEAEKSNDPEWGEKRKERLRKNPPDHFQTILKNLRIDGEVDKSEAGIWVIFQKPLK